MSASVRRRVLRGIRDRADAATEGPFDVEHVRVWRGRSTPEQVEVARTGLPGDAQFVASAREDVLWLLAEVDRQAAVIKRQSGDATIVRRIRTLVAEGSLYGSVDCDELDAALNGED